MGRVVFVGAGPGDADLITLRGAKRLAEAEVVLYDALTDPALRELAPRARWIGVGKRGFSPQGSTEQATIDALLVRHARESAVVVRLKGGDPSVFGRLEEELAALAAAGIACEVVPGVTAALAAAAATQRPLTRRGTRGASGRSVALATAFTRAGDVQATKTADTEVFYMAGKQLAVLARRLAEAGWDAATRVLVVSRAGCADMRQSDHTVHSLAQASLLHAGRPTVVTVGAGAAPLDLPWAPSGAAAVHTPTARVQTLKS